MSVEEARTRAVNYARNVNAKLKGDPERLRGLLTTALAGFESLAIRANARDNVAKTTLELFGRGSFDKGVDALLAQAKAEAQSSPPRAANALADFKAAGAIAYGWSNARTITAYEGALALAPDNAESLGNLWYVYGLSKRLDEALAIADRLGALPAPEAQLAGRLAKGDILFARSDLPAAEAAFNVAADYAIEARFNARAAETLTFLGVIAARLNAFDRTIAYYERALVLNTQMDEKAKSAELLRRLGNVASVRSDYAGATNYLSRALALHVALDDKNAQVEDLDSMILVATSGYDYQAQEIAARRALALNIELGRKLDQAWDLKIIGEGALARRKRKEACGYFQQSLALYESNGGSAGQLDEIRFRVRDTCR